MCSSQDVTKLTSFSYKINSAAKSYTDLGGGGEMIRGKSWGQQDPARECIKGQPTCCANCSSQRETLNPRGATSVSVLLKPVLQSPGNKRMAAMLKTAHMLGSRAQQGLDRQWYEHLSDNHSCIPRF